MLFRSSLNLTKVQSHVMLVLHNVMMVPSNARKNNRITECDKIIVTYNVRIAQCDDEIIKCKEKIREPLNVTKELSYVTLELHNVRMKSSNMRKK